MYAAASANHMAVGPAIHFMALPVPQEGRKVPAGIPFFASQLRRLLVSLVCCASERSRVGARAGLRHALLLDRQKIRNDRQKRKRAVQQQ